VFLLWTSTPGHNPWLPLGDFPFPSGCSGASPTRLPPSNYAANQQDQTHSCNYWVVSHRPYEHEGHPHHVAQRLHVVKVKSHSHLPSSKLLGDLSDGLVPGPSTPSLAHMVTLPWHLKPSSCLCAPLRSQGPLYRRPRRSTTSLRAPPTAPPGQK
jgi:hypothetical protein